MNNDELSIGTVFQIGPLVFSNSLLTSIGVTVLLMLAAVAIRSRLTNRPGRLQTIAEAGVMMIDNAVKEVVPHHTDHVMPFIATLWLFLLSANLVGLIPELHSPTRDLSVTSALALVVFASVHWFGIRAHGVRRYAKHYLKPNPILLPFHIVSELSRTLALAVRLFGNMMSLEMSAFLVLLVAGFLVPVPLLMLHVIEAVVQAYIFGMLALIYIGSGLELQEQSHQASTD